MQDRGTTGVCMCGGLQTGFLHLTGTRRSQAERCGKLRFIPCFSHKAQVSFLEFPGFSKGCSLEGILSKCSMRSLAAGARGFPRDVWMLVGAPGT